MSSESPPSTSLVPMPLSESSRLLALQSYDIMDSGQELRYDDITLLASRICHTPMALITLINDDRQWFKSKIGLDCTGIPRELAFCAHAIVEPDKVLTVVDARLDDRFAANPFVTGDPHARFYAGAPLVSADGHALGTLCVIDREPRHLEPDQKDALLALSRQVMALMEERRTSAALRGAMQALARSEALFREAYEQDITERKNIERGKAEFLTMVGHELRTPVTALRGALGILAAGAAGELPPKAQALTALADRNADRLHRLVDDILDIEKIESGAFAYRRTDIDLNQLVTQAAVELRPYADQYQVKIEVRSDLPRAFLHADADRLMQVLANLISNAVKYSPVGGTINMHVTRTAQSFRVDITDHGEGIPEEFRPHIFEKFAQANCTATNRKGGSGLGLNISRAIIQHHGGVLAFDTELGAGSTFYFELPIL